MSKEKKRPKPSSSALLKRRSTVSVAHGTSWSVYCEQSITEETKPLILMFIAKASKPRAFASMMSWRVCSSYISLIM